MELVLVLALCALVFVAALTSVAVVGVVRLSGRVRRRAARAASMLRLRAAALPGGPRRDVADLRLRLRESLRHSQVVLANPAVLAATVHTSACADAVAHLRHASEELDARLALIEREPDEMLRGHLLLVLAPRAERVIADAAALRRAAYALTIELEEPGSAHVQRDLRDRVDGLLLAVRELARPV